MSQIEFIIDCSDSYTKYDSTNIGLFLAFVKSDTPNRQLLFYKDNKETGTLLETGETNVTGALGSTSITYSLSQTYELESGQEYTIYVPDNNIMTYHDTNKSRNRVDRVSPAITITIFGGVDNSALTCENTFPTDNDTVAERGVMTFIFSGDIKLATDATASLYKTELTGQTLIKSVNLSVSENDPKAAVADFGGEVLNATETYSVMVSKEAVLLNDDSETTLSQSISLTFAGGTYKMFGYKSVSPSSGTVHSKIGTVTIIPDWPEEAAGFISVGTKYYNEETGKPWSFYVTLYKGEDSTGEPVLRDELELNSSGTALQLRLNNFTLDANTTYALVIPEGLIPAYSKNCNNSNSHKTGSLPQ